MCLAVPGRIVEIVDQTQQIAKVEVGGVRRNISVALLDDVKVGDWVLIHVGFAIQKVDEEEALQTLAFLHQLGGAFSASGDAPSSKPQKRIRQTGAKSVEFFRPASSSHAPFSHRLGSTSTAVP